MHKRLPAILGFLLLIGQVHAQQVRPGSTNYLMPTDVQPVGGGEAAKSTNYVLNDTIGEVNIGPSRGTSYDLNAGYRQTTESSISMNCDGTVALGTVTGNGQRTGSGTCVVTTDSPAGYQLTWQSGVNNTNGLVGYWPLDETAGTTAYDHSGYGNAGTLTNSPTISSDVPSHYFSTRSVSFDGTNKHISVADSTALQLSRNFTVSVWFNANSTQPANYPSLVSKSASTTDGWLIGFKAATKQFGITRPGFTAIAYTPTDVSANVWHHGVVTVGNGTTATVNVYVDGVLQATATTTEALAVTTTPLAIGRDNGCSAVLTTACGNFSGLIDDVRIYNRALSPDEITNLASKSPAGSLVASGSQVNHIDPFNYPATGGLLGLWRMDEPVTGTVADASNGLHDGTPNGTSGTNNKPQPSNDIPASMTSRDYRSLNFDGTDDYVDAGNVLNMGTNDLTLSAWVKTATSSAGGNVRAIAGKSFLGSQTGRYSLLFENGNIEGLTDIGGGGLTVTSSETPYIDNNWHLFTLVFNRSGNMILYADGISIGSTSISAGSAVNMSTSDKFFIGAYQDGTGTAPASGKYLNGNIDDVRVYSRALTAAEVKGLYGTPNTWTVGTTATAFGGRVRSSSTDADSKWGTDGASSKWLAIGDGSYQVARRTSRTATTGSTETFQYRAEIGSTAIQTPGSYTATLVITATTL
jgi:hypothetical protein